jgi:hypothetical protein
MSGMLTMMAGGDSKIVYLATTLGTGNFTSPTGYGLVTVEAIGGGGRGLGSAGPLIRCGGGGGSYASSRSITVTGGSTIVYYTVGGQAADSWVNAGTNAAPTTLTVGCLGKGGINAASAVPGQPGTGSIGSIIFRGGTGGIGSTGDGGGGGGINGAGSGRTAGRIAPMGDGGGGTLSIGLVPGGAGGPATTNGTNRSGAIGRVRITFYNQVWR